ncbi:MAG: sulfatase [Mariniblastus sp.]|nr:sulfatase [Mariniblastus sp.]
MKTIQPNGSRNQWLLAVALTVLIGTVPAEAADQGARPNILLLVGDNWAWPHAGACGDRSVKTPTFDRIAKRGVLFTHTFCQVPSCSAARAVLLTGQASHRLEDAANLWGLFPDHLTTYTAILREHGYATGYTVKGWGPGIYRGAKHTRLNPAGTAYKSFDGFLQKVPQGKPFCFWFGSHDPHQPWNRGDDFRGDLDPDQVEVPPYVPDHPVTRQAITDYYAEVQRFDHECGQMLTLLAERGQLDNTLVIMLGDNGWQLPRGLANVYDAGTRVPMAIEWPGKMEGGRTSDALISFEDIAPTLLTAAGITPPAEMTGHDFLPLATGTHDVAWRDALFLERERHANVRARHRSYPCRAVRTDTFLYVRNLMPELWPAGDPQWHWAVGPYGDLDNTPIKQLILQGKNQAAFQPFFQLGFAKRPAEELYDLGQDPHQLVNVADQAKYAGTKQTLSDKLDAWMKATDDPRAVDPRDPRFDRYPYFGQAARSKRTEAAPGAPTAPGGRISVALEAPAANYRIRIEEVYDVGSELWAVSVIDRHGDIGAAVITPIREEIPLTLPINRTLKQKVLGKDWNWGEETESLQYIDDRAALLRMVEQQNGRRIWQRPP